MSQPAIFLDRDGVLNAAFQRDGRSVPPAGLAELRILPGVPEACEALRQAGFELVIVTNQPDVARGTTTREAIAGINGAVSRMLSIAQVWTCYHDDSDFCECRKPRPGMLLAAARTLDIKLESSFMVGDRERDVEAGRAAGCRTVLVSSVNPAPSTAADYTVGSLLEASRVILELEREARSS